MYHQRFLSYPVDTLLHEPTLARMATPSEIGIDMISLFTQMDVLCKKELLEQPSHTIQNGRTSRSFMDKVSVIEDRMKQTLVKDRSFPTSIHDYLERTSLSLMFPRPAAFLKDPSGFSLMLEQSRTDEYLSCLNQLNQLSSLSHQINEDVIKLPRPKYLAHQLALLYQSMSSLPSASEWAQYRKAIESNFKTIKEALSTDDQPEKPLPEQIREWVWELTKEVAELAESLPSQMTQVSLLPACVLAQM